jgi:hypothetical protein
MGNGMDGGMGNGGWRVVKSNPTVIYQSSKNVPGFSLRQIQVRKARFNGRPNDDVFLPRHQQPCTFEISDTWSLYLAVYSTFLARVWVSTK